MAEYKEGEIITLGSKKYRVKSSFPCKLCALYGTAECENFTDCLEVLGVDGYLVKVRKKSLNP